MLTSRKRIPCAVLILVGATINLCASRPIIVGSTDQDDPSAVWKEARAVQMQGSTPLLVLAFPEQAEIRNVVREAAKNPTAELLELMSLMQIAFIKLEFMQQTLPKLQAKSNAALLDRQGNLLLGGHLAYGQMDHVGKLTSAVSTFLRQENGAILKALTKASRGKLDRAVQDRLDANLLKLDSDSYKSRRAAKKALAEMLPQAAWVIYTYRLQTDSIEVRESCKQLLGANAEKRHCELFGVPEAGGEFGGRDIFFR